MLLRSLSVSLSAVPVRPRARDHAVQVEGSALFVFRLGGNIYPPAIASRKFPLQVFRQHVHAKAHNQKGDGNTRHYNRNYVCGIYGGKNERERKARAKQLNRIFRHFNKPMHARLFCPFQIHAVTHRRHNDGKRQRDGDQAQKRNAQSGTKSQVKIQRIGEIGGISHRKGEAYQEFGKTYFVFQAHSQLPVQKHRTNTIHRILPFGNLFQGKNRPDRLHSCDCCVIIINNYE